MIKCQGIVNRLLPRAKIDIFMFFCSPTAKKLKIIYDKEKQHSWGYEAGTSKCLEHLFWSLQIWLEMFCSSPSEHPTLLPQRQPDPLSLQFTATKPDTLSWEGPQLSLSVFGGVNADSNSCRLFCSLAVFNCATIPSISDAKVG